MAILRNGKNTQQYNARWFVEAKAKAEIETQANAASLVQIRSALLALDRAKADMQKKLDNKTDKVLYALQYGVGSTPTIAELALLIQCYSDAGLLVPDCLSSSLCYMVNYASGECQAYKPWV